MNAPDSLFSEGASRHSAAHLRRRMRAWRNMATSATMRRLDPAWVPRPHAGHFMVTWKCNLRCAGCGSWKVTDHEELSTQEWVGVFKQLDSLDIVKVLGGEPLVRPDIIEILSAIREHVDPYLLQMTTNGMLSDRLVEAIHAIGWPGLQLRISLDGTERTHDRMRGMQGSYKTVSQTIATAARLQGRYGFRLGVNFAVTDDSIGDVEDMVRFCQDLDVDLIPGINVDPFLVGTVPPEVRQQKFIMIDDPQRALDTIEDLRVGTRRQLPLLDHVFSKWITHRTFQHQVVRGQYRFPCRELRDLMYMMPDGDVVRCGLDHAPLGNVRQQTVDEIWYGDRVREARRKVDACPGCIQASIQIMSRLYGGCLFGS